MGLLLEAWKLLEVMRLLLLILNCKPSWLEVRLLFFHHVAWNSKLTLMSLIEVLVIRAHFRVSCHHCIRPWMGSLVSTLRFKTSIRLCQSNRLIVNLNQRRSSSLGSLRRIIFFLGWILTKRNSSYLLLLPTHHHLVFRENLLITHELKLLVFGFNWRIIQIFILEGRVDIGWHAFNSHRILEWSLTPWVDERQFSIWLNRDIWHQDFILFLLRTWILRIIYNRIHFFERVPRIFVL